MRSAWDSPTHADDRQATFCQHIAWHAATAFENLDLHPAHGNDKVSLCQEALLRLGRVGLGCSFSCRVQLPCPRPRLICSRPGELVVSALNSHTARLFPWAPHPEQGKNEHDQAERGHPEERRRELCLVKESLSGRISDVLHRLADGVHRGADACINVRRLHRWEL